MTFVEKRSMYKWIFVAGFVLLICLMVFSSTLGVADISFGEAVKIIREGVKTILSKVPVVNWAISAGGISDTHSMIVLQIRMPRIVLAALVGMGLSVVGAAFQGMFRNPMADPYVLGISSGAALGATVAIVAGFGAALLGMGMVSLAAFGGAVLTTFMVYSIARVGNKIPTVTLILAGIAIGFLASSLISIMMIFNREQVEKIVFWTLGSVSAAKWSQIGILFPVVAAGTGIITAFSRDLNVMSTGDEAARSLGIEVERVKKILLVVSSLVIASCVSVSGIIGFVGLIIPHMIRLVFGSDHRVVLPFSTLAGAIFMVLSDTLARILVPPAEIPVGAITSCFGAPFFIYLLIKSKKKVMI